VSSSTANKVMIREAGPASNDGYVVPVVVAAAAAFGFVWQARQGRTRTTPGWSHRGCPNGYCATWMVKLR
jgi:hypothetical protein